MPLFKRCKCEDPCEKQECLCKCHGFIRRNKLIRRTAALGGIIVGLYYAGVALGWWPNIIG